MQANKFYNLMRLAEGVDVELSAAESFELSRESSASILKICGSSDLSLYICLLTFVKALISRYTGESQVMIASPPPQLAGAQPDGSFALLEDQVDVAGDLKKNILDTRAALARVHSKERSSGSEPPRSERRSYVLCSLQSIHGSVVAESFPVAIHFSRENACITCNVVYWSGFLDQALMRAFADSLSHFIDCAAGDFTQRISQIDLISPAMEKAVLNFGTGAQVAIGEPTLHALIEHQARVRPTATAIRVATQSLTYERLDTLASRAASKLRSANVGLNDFVAIVSEQSLEMVVLMLATLKVGAAFVPISHKQTIERTKAILSVVQPKLAVTDKPLSLRPLLPSIADMRDLKLLEDAAASADLPEVRVPSSAAAYAIFTSGSTGVPKGVLNEHRGIANACLWRSKEYGFDETCKKLILFAQDFDGFVLNAFTALISGAEVILLDDSARSNPQLIAGSIRNHGVTHITLVPMLYEAILRHSPKGALSTLRHVTLAGDVTAAQTLQLSSDLYPGVLVSNGYGPTENAVISTYHRSMSPGSPNVMGKPIENVNAFVLNSRAKPMPPGVFGELYLGGVGLAREYIRNQRATRQSFITWRGQRVYKTGDLARWLADGTLEFGGRIDNYVKIRGYRIELGDIKTHLAQHSAVIDAVVLNVFDTIHACYVAEQPVESQVLKDFLSTRLPSYMVPQAFHHFERLPTTVAGKYDVPAIKEKIKTLAKEEHSSAGLTRTELTMLEIWKKVLPVAEFGVDQSFFSLGGQSLSAIRLLADIFTEFQVELNLDQFFRADTIRLLSELVDSSSSRAQDSIPRAPELEFYPLAGAQEGLLSLSSIDELDVSYNLPVVFELPGKINIDDLHETLTTLAQRHESLRTAFTIVSNKPVQRVDSRCEVEVNRKGLGDASKLDECLLAQLRPFDLQKAPLWRVSVIDAPGDVSYLLFDFNHLIVDEHSLDIFFREFSALSKDQTLKPLPITYKDFAHWQGSKRSSPEYLERLNWWKERLLRCDLEPLNLPYDRIRESRRSYHGDIVSVSLGSQETGKVMEFMKEHNCTFFMLMMAFYVLMLFKYTNRTSIVIGSPVSERTHPETKDLVGFFLNTVPFVNELSPRMTFDALLEEVKASVISSLDQSEVQFGDMVAAMNVQRRLDVSPIYNTILAVVDNPLEINLGHTSVRNIPLASRTSKFDLSLQVLRNDTELSLNLEYASALFNRDSIERMLQNFLQLVDQVLSDSKRALAEYAILSATEEEQIAGFEIGAYVDSPSDETLVSLFERRVAVDPDRIALIDGVERLTYGELNRKANGLALSILPKIERGDLVAILCDRSACAVVSILAVLKAGAGYLPVDTSYPDNRINEILAVGKPRLLITNVERQSRLSFTGPVETISLQSIRAVEENLRNKPHADDLAYVLFTSGTTGRPKGVQISHRNVASTVTSLLATIDVSARDAWTLFHSYCFDVSMWELYGCLFSGGALVVVKESQIRDASLLAELLRAHEVTVLCQPPSAFYLLSDELIAAKRSEILRYVFVAGEALKTSRIRNWLNHYGPQNATLFNAYGITETSIYSTVKRVLEDDARNESRSIGAPLSNCYIYILNPDLQRCPIGVVGEIYIGGFGVGVGYWNDSVQTSQRFVSDPFAKEKVVYKTGDLAKWLPNGEIEYVARADTQVKIRGHRTEVAEVELVLARYPNLTDVAVVVQQSNVGENQLAAFFTAKEPQDLTSIRNHMANNLPQFMVPSQFVQLESFPTNSSGKIDKTALRELGSAQEVTAPRPQSDLEHLLAEIWSDILGTPAAKISGTDNFFAIGGDSISAFILAKRLKSLNYDVEVSSIFEFPTFLDQCAILEELRRKAEQAQAEPAETAIVWSTLANSTSHSTPESLP